MTADLGAAGFAPVVGTDLSAVALDLAEGADAWGAAAADRLPFPDATFACVTSLDVIEHVDDDVAALREYRRVLRPGGVVVVAVPAYQWAWSAHDVALGHRRRYTAGRLRASLEQAGLQVDRVSYFHSWLVPPAVLLRKTPLGRLVAGSDEEASFVSPRVNRALRSASSAERAVLARRDLPFGLSVLGVAHR